MIFTKNDTKENFIYKTKLENGHVLASFNKSYFFPDLDGFTAAKREKSEEEQLTNILNGIFSGMVYQLKNHGMYEDLSDTLIFLHKELSLLTLVSIPEDSKFSKAIVNFYEFTERSNENFDYNWYEDCLSVFSFCCQIVRNFYKEIIKLKESKNG